MITVVGWPRSGTHWLKTMLGHALGEEVAHSHFWPETEGEYVLIVRDPRDAFASHWRMFQHDQPDSDLTELEFVNYFMKGEGLAQSWGVGWVEHTLKLMSFEGIYPFVRYETLHAQPEQALIQILSIMRETVPQLLHIMQAVLQTSGVRCDPSTLPVDVEMGEPGKWEAQLQPDTVRALLAYCGELMVELGYGSYVRRA